MVFVWTDRPGEGRPRLFAGGSVAPGDASVFVGDGPATGSLRAEFPEAQILGWKRPEEVAGLMRAARALVFLALCDAKANP